MASRILEQAMATEKSKVAICCSFMFLAATTAYTCPIADAAGIQGFTSYSGNSIIQSNSYQWAQSSGDVGFATPGQETLKGGATTGMIATGASGYRGNLTINANDHQVYSDDGIAQYVNGGMTWDTAYMEGYRMPLPATSDNGISSTLESNVTNQTTTNTTETESATQVALRPFDEKISIERSTIGTSGMYIGGKAIEQGASDVYDYAMVNSRGMGVGTFANDLEVSSQVGFFANSPDVNYQTEISQHERVSGEKGKGYNATVMTTVESFATVFMSPAINTTTEGIL